VYVAVLVENENVSLVKSKDRTMMYPLFAATPERGRRNYVTIFCFALVLLELFCKLVIVACKLVILSLDMLRIASGPSLEQQLCECTYRL